MEKEELSEAELKKRKKGLQKLPKCSQIQKGLEDLLISMVCQNQAYVKEKYEKFSDEMKEDFQRIIQHAAFVLGYEDLDIFFQAHEEVMSLVSRRSLWEFNHVSIMNAIDHLTKEKNRFPARREISEETGLSFQTINKHLKEYFASKHYNERKDEYVLLKGKVVIYNL